MEEKILFDATVNLLVKDSRVLLALKTVKIGAGCWMGYGGGLDDKEKPIDCAIRELEEESGLITSPEHLEKVAIGFFNNTKTDGQTFVCKVHFYFVKNWQGEVKETETMINPTWFDIDNLPIDNFMPADKEFIPLILKGKKIIIRAKYSPYQKELLEPVEIIEVSAFPED